MRDDFRDPALTEPFDDAPAAELAFAVDDADAPTEVTVYPEDDVDVTTTWLTIDVDHVVDLKAHA